MLSVVQASQPLFVMQTYINVFPHKLKELLLFFLAFQRSIVVHWMRGNLLDQLFGLLLIFAHFRLNVVLFKNELANWSKVLVVLHHSRYQLDIDIFCWMVPSRIILYQLPQRVLLVEHLIWLLVFEAVPVSISYLWQTILEISFCSFGLLFFCHDGASDLREVQVQHLLVLVIKSTLLVLLRWWGCLINFLSLPVLQVLLDDRTGPPWSDLHPIASWAANKSTHVRFKRSLIHRLSQIITHLMLPIFLLRCLLQNDQ